MACHTRKKITADFLGDFPSRPRKSLGATDFYMIITSRGRLHGMVYHVLKRRYFNVYDWSTKKSQRKSAVIFPLDRVAETNTLHVNISRTYGGFPAWWRKNLSRMNKFILEKNPSSPSKSAVTFLLVWQSTTVCVLSNEEIFRDFPLVWQDHYTCIYIIAPPVLQIPTPLLCLTEFAAHFPRSRGGFVCLPSVNNDQTTTMIRYS